MVGMGRGILVVFADNVDDPMVGLLFIIFGHPFEQW